MFPGSNNPPSPQIRDDSGCSLDDLCLDFVLPGTDIELAPGGPPVTISNVEEYLCAVVNYTLKEGMLTTIT